MPVVIVASEEALAAVPRSMREASLATGATKFQTIMRVVLPAAAPGILTGLILAMARGAGEVAPLMITGVVKLAPDMPLDGIAPFLHLERKFMHLGYHIYDVGFQSPNVEAAKPMVYATTILLLMIVVALNLTAIIVRNQLRGSAIRRRRSSWRQRRTVDHERVHAESTMPSDRPLIKTDVQFRRRNRRRRRARPAIVIRDANLFYGAEAGAVRHLDGHRGEAGHGVHRSVGLRQVDAAAMPEPDERPDRQRADHRERSTRTGRTSTPTTTDVIEVRRRIGMVFQKSNPLPKSIYENVVYGLRDRRHPEQGDARRRMRAQPAGRGAVGRGEGPPPRERALAVGRPAAAALHRPRDRRSSRRSS